MNNWFAKLKLNKNKESVKVIFVEGSPHKYQGYIYTDVKAIKIDSNFMNNVLLKTGARWLQQQQQRETA